MEQTKVLIVEDDTNIREMYTEALRSVGLTVFTAENGAEGVKQALKQHPDVILMDITLPDFSGHDAVEKIRVDSWGKDAKIIFLTNRTDPANISEAVAAGSEEYIIKVHKTPHEVVNIVRAVSNS